jgi:hypothetical protein
MTEHASYGPTLQMAMFTTGSVADSQQVDVVAERARRLFAD